MDHVRSDSRMGTTSSAPVQLLAIDERISSRIKSDYLRQVPPVHVIYCDNFTDREATNRSELPLSFVFIYVTSFSSHTLHCVCPRRHSNRARKILRSLSPRIAPAVFQCLQVAFMTQALSLAGIRTRPTSARIVHISVAFFSSSLP